MLQKPTVGRIVHFYTKDTSLQINGVGEGPYAAMIVQPHGDRCASLTVFPPFAPPYSAGSVNAAYELDTDASQAMYSRWEWPPIA